MRALAADGRTVFVSSHLMNEMAVTAEHLIVVGRGRLIADVSVDEFIQQASQNTVRVRSPQAATLHDLLVGPDIAITTIGRSVFEVSGLSADRIGEVAAGAGLTLHELSPQQPSLEEAFMALTHDAVEYTATATRPPAGTGRAA